MLRSDWIVVQKVLRCASTAVWNAVTAATSVSRAERSTLILVERAALQAAAFTTGLGQAAATSPFCVLSVLSSVASAASTVATSGPKAFSSVSQAVSTWVLAAVSLRESRSRCADTHSALAAG